MKTIMLTIAILPVSMGLFVYGHSRGVAAAHRGVQLGPEGAEIPQPEQWVAFHATVLRTQPGTPDLAGDFWRSSDGSTRLELWTNGKLESVMIKNVFRSLLYTFASRRGWVRQPMVLPPNGYRPLRHHANPNLIKEDALLEGRVVYRSHSPDGEITKLAPALNFFVLVRDSANGKREEYSNVRVELPNPNLFEPPVDAVVIHQDEPGGIIWKPRRQ
jgi:hypothetical protein